MEGLTNDIDELNISTPKRSSRKRILTEPPPTPPAKRKSKPLMLTEDKIKKFYMNKTGAKFARQALETIYEDPTCKKSGSTLLIGTSKIKRAIVMQSGVTTKHKKMCRKKKLRRLGMKWGKHTKISDEDFKKRLMLFDASLCLTEKIECNREVDTLTSVDAHSQSSSLSNLIQLT